MDCIIILHICCVWEILSFFILSCLQFMKILLFFISFCVDVVEELHRVAFRFVCLLLWLCWDYACARSSVILVENFNILVGNCWPCSPSMGVSFKGPPLKGNTHGWAEWVNGIWQSWLWKFSSRLKIVEAFMMSQQVSFCFFFFFFFIRSDCKIM